MTPEQQQAFNNTFDIVCLQDEFGPSKVDIAGCVEIIESVLAVKPKIKFEWTKIDAHVQACHVDGALIGKICEQYDFLENEFVNESWTNKWRGYFINQHGSGSSECEERSRTAVETAFTEWYNGIGSSK